MSFTLADMERDQANVFLANQGLYLHDNHIWPIAGPPVPLAPHAVRAVQLLWDAEWDRIKVDIEPLFKKQQAEAAVRKAEARRHAERYVDEGEQRKAEAEAESKRYREAATQRSRKEKDRAHLFEQMGGGISEHHLYGPRGFKNPFKYEETNENWALPTIFPKGHIGGQLHYRPERPLADDRRLSIVTAGICGDPPKGRSALEGRK